MKGGGDGCVTAPPQNQPSESGLILHIKYLDAYSCRLRESVLRVCYGMLRGVTGSVTGGRA